MSSAPRRRTSEGSTKRAWIAVSPALTQGHGIVLAGAAEVSSRGELGKDG